MRISSSFCLLLVTLFFHVNAVFGQTDTVRVLQYNLLNYGNSANPPAYKNQRLSTIIQYAQPDIFGANEIASDLAHSINILTNVLGSGWEKGSYINTNNEVQTNMLFWKSSKFGLKSEQSICQNLRDIIAYRLYYKDTITVPHDTVFLTVIVAHLKASQGTLEELARAQETQAIVDYLDSIGEQDNYILLGDLNLYTSDEEAYQNIISSNDPASRLNDPINIPGDWHNNVAFSSIHTQSTRTAQLSDGGVNGGLDDRFDFQLVSDYIMGDSAGVMYVPGSYTALGQDGLHFNKAIIDTPVNTSAPASVIQALHEMSDHLPTLAKYVVHADVPVKVRNEIAYDTKVINPLVGDELCILFDEKLAGETLNILLYTIDGKIAYSARLQVKEGRQFQRYKINDLAAGSYILGITGTGFRYNAQLVSY